MLEWPIVGWLLLVTHAFADGIFQPDWMAKMKHPKKLVHRDEFDVEEDNPLWFPVLSCHSIANGGAITITIGLITGNWYMGMILGMLEAWCHFWIDFSSTRKLISFTMDQALHLACKVVWLVVYCAYAYIK